jgi:hypothetical protein
MSQQSLSRTQSVVAIAIVIVLAFLAYAFLTAPDNRSFTDRVGDAFHALPRGVGPASEQLQDRTPAQKVGDSIKDQGQKIKDNADSND